jgi:hypothetical protein
MSHNTGLGSILAAALNPKAMKASELPSDMSNIKATGFNVECKFLSGTSKTFKDVSDLSAVIYQACNAALLLDMPIGQIIIEPIYGEKA